MTGWTPDELARYDQLLADADTELARLVRTLRIGTAEAGPHQAVASVAKLLAQRPATELAGLLTAALRHLPEPGRDPDPRTSPGPGRD